MSSTQLVQQLAVRGCDLLRREHAVHEVVEARGGEHQLDVVDRSMGVHEAQALVEQLIAHGHVGLQPGHVADLEANLPVEQGDLGVGLSDERVLG